MLKFHLFHLFMQSIHIAVQQQLKLHQTQTLVCVLTVLIVASLLFLYFCMFLETWWDDRGMGVALHLIVGVSKYRIVRSLFVTEQDLRDNGDLTVRVSVELLSCFI